MAAPVVGGNLKAPVLKPNSGAPTLTGVVAKVTFAALVVFGTGFMIYATNGFTLGVFTGTYLCGAAFLLMCAIAVISRHVGRPVETEVKDLPFPNRSRAGSFSSVDSPTSSSLIKEHVEDTWDGDESVGDLSNVLGHPCYLPLSPIRTN